MTATPIPRTVAMTVFGDLETSALTELPAGRAPIQTTVVAVREQPAWLDRAWQRVREEVGRGARSTSCARGSPPTPPVTTARTSPTSRTLDPDGRPRTARRRVRPAKRRRPVDGRGRGGRAPAGRRAARGAARRGAARTA